MASTSGNISTVAILSIVIILIAIINIVIVSAVREGELNVVFGVLRARGYHLFANAIATSDLHYDIKSNGNFTLFAPINSALFALDMTMAASNYVSALRYHVVPRRLSIAELLSLPPGSNSVPTLVPGQDILVEQRRSPRSLITVGGVDVVVPGMFYGRDIAVHGLGGILEFRPPTMNSPANLTGASLSNLSGNLTLQSPITDLPNNQTSMNVYPNADIPPLLSPNSTQESPPPLVSNSTNNTVQIPVAVQPPPVSNSTRNNTVKIPVAVQPSPSSNLTKNRTAIYPGTAPTTSTMSSTGQGIAMHLAPSPNLPPTYSTFFVQSREEHVPRAKLLELTSDGRYDLSPATEPTSNGLQQFTPVDDKTVECSLADNDDDQLNAAIHARKLYIASTMVCAQK
ncbi:hypothetical protein L6452_01415 [Arctium lappa]|uniref:Uncharacterized protein n=1 Tax=Arctium lappa TaxID=4217 RepID=A0ACB9FG25_ARCLA|nr:hypothetical protein L6452_01415 [Arctium lappa]